MGHYPYLHSFLQRLNCDCLAFKGGGIGGCRKLLTYAVHGKWEASYASNGIKS